MQADGSQREKKERGEVAFCIYQGVVFVGRTVVQNYVQAEVRCEEFVHTDQKWIAFILNQIVLNGVNAEDIMRALSNHYRGKALEYPKHYLTVSYHMQPGLRENEFALQSAGKGKNST